MQGAAYKANDDQLTPARVPGYARWGLLLLLVFTAVGLVAGSFVGLRTARNAALAVARATGIALVRETRRELWRSQGDFAGGLKSIQDELGDDGLRYVAILDADQHVLVAAGTADKELLDEIAQRGLRARQHFAFAGDVRHLPLRELGQGRRFHAVVPLLPGPPANMQGPRHMRERGPAMLRHMNGPRGEPRGGPRGRNLRARRDLMRRLTGKPPHYLVFSFVPVEARGIVQRALWTFAVSLLAALLLLAAGLWMWRLQGRAEALREQLAADSQLKSLGQMSAVLGHELRNPLTALKGHAQLLLELLDDGKPGHSSASQVVREAQRLEKLTGEVLNFARSGQVQLEPVQVVDFVRGCVDRAQAGEVELHLQNAPAQWSLDPARMERVLVNLLRNARQSAGEQGRVKISVAGQNGMLLIRVEDNGPGLAPGEDPQKLFEPFVTSKIQGTGLGLALAKGIVEAHGGEIGAEQAGAGGAIFWLKLPVNNL